MQREDSSMFKGCLDESINVLRTIEFIKAATKYKWDNQTNNPNPFDWNDIHDIPKMIRAMKYGTTSSYFDSNVPKKSISIHGIPKDCLDLDGSYSFHRPGGGGGSGGGKPFVLEVNGQVIPHFNFANVVVDGGGMSFYAAGTDETHAGENITFNVKSLAGYYEVKGYVRMSDGSTPKPNISYLFGHDQTWSDKIPYAETQTFNLQGLFRGFKVKINNTEFFSSPGMYIKSITIPKYVNDLGESCFQDAYQLETVYFEADITKLPSHCFAYCENLRTLNLPKSLVEIGDHCFVNDSTFNTASTLDLGMKNLVKIGAYAFSYNTMASLVLGENVSEIGQSAFANCIFLNQITAKCVRPPKILTDSTGNGTSFYNVKTNGQLIIPADADYKEWVQWCSSSRGPYSHLLERGWEIVQDNEVVWTGDYSDDKTVMYTTTDHQRLFSDADCTRFAATDYYYSSRNLGVIRFENPLTRIDMTLFGNRETLETIILPKSVTVLGHGAFYNSWNLKSFTVPAQVTTFEDSVFRKCHSLKTVTFEPGCTVSEITRDCFESMSSLEYVEFPPTINSIYGAPFRGGHKLRYLKFTSPTPPVMHDYQDDDPKYSAFYDIAYRKNNQLFIPPVYCPNSSYKTAPAWSYWYDQGYVRVLG